MTSAIPSLTVAELAVPNSRTANLSALFVLNSLNVGGSETKTTRIVNGLLQRGVRTGIAYLNEPNVLLEALAPEIPTWNLERRGKFSLAALKRLRALIEQERPTHVLAVNLYPALYVTLATAMSRTPVQTVALLNTTDLPDGEQWREAFYRPFLRRMDRIVYGCGLQQTEWMARLQLDQARSSVIYNGVDTEHFAPLSSTTADESKRVIGVPAHEFVVGTIGRLEREKNQRSLLEAVAALRKQGVPAHLLVVGEGSLREHLEMQATRLGIGGHVTFAGRRRDVRPLLAAMDVFVLPSTHVETFSNAALEAMALARPVVLSRIGGADEMVRDGVDGWTIAPQALDSKLPPLLKQLHDDAVLRQTVGRAARERVVGCFSAQAMIDAFATLISSHPAHR